MNLAIDIGNTRAKAAVMESGRITELFKTGEITPACLEKIVPKVEKCIMVSTRVRDEALEDYLGKSVKKFIYFDHTVPVPVKNLYKTPRTLGPDRLAAAVGAWAIYPGENVMIVDFGTAVTIDFLTAAGEYLGGNISPGAESRFRALHGFTGKLPLCSLSRDTELSGSSTASAIESGVVEGMTYELEGYITRLSGKYGDMKIIFTGGDGDFFAERLKNTIFVTSDLVLYGLNEILEYNV